MTTSNEATRRTEEAREEMQEWGTDYLPMAARAGRNAPDTYARVFDAACIARHECGLAAMCRMIALGI